MKKRVSPQVSERKYVVAIPIPSLDRRGRKLGKARIMKWTRIVQAELTECLGGATPMPSPGTNILDGKILYEKDQVLVLSACDDRPAFLAKRARIHRLARRMMIELNQEAVIVLAVPSDSFIVEMPPSARS